MTKSVWAAVSAMVLGLGAVVYAEASEDLTPVVPINVFATVTDGIYRGARPDLDGLKALQGLGVKTDLDLEDDQAVVNSETDEVNTLGIRMISMPMSGFWAPNDQEVSQILSILADSTNYPIFVHCQHGQDRTGVIVALYRVFYQHWTPQAAHDEMMSLGFHPQLVLLEHYFDEKTGFSP